MSDDAADGQQQEAGLTTGEVARRLGVAPTTVRSWDRRYGLGPAGRVGGGTAGGRRWTSRSWSGCAP
ncbi:MerR family DNA-binding transcriptional regulator [Streptomyces zhihengii]